jgi:transcriptional regulator with XRE-family HTH domain
MKLAKAISRRIRDLREAAGLSQQDLAVRADLSMSQVAKLEQGKKADPRASTLLALAGALAVAPGKLLEDLRPPLPEGGPDLDVAPEFPPKEEKKKKKKKSKKSKAGDAALPEDPALPEATPAPEGVAPAAPLSDMPVEANDMGKKKKKKKAKHKQ